MQISIVNHTKRILDHDLQRVIRAINRQISEDFEPYWGMSARLRLEGRSADKPDELKMPDLRGDAVIYLWDETNVDGALGYHFQNAKGIPFGFVFTEISQSIGEPWSVTLSHEALELIGDPETNLLVMGPHPTEDRDVFHWFEMCDAVQADVYTIDEIAVSNFVLPLYFTGTRDTDEVGARNDFLGSQGNGGLKSFGINPGGYVGFFDPEKQDHDTYSIKGDGLAAMRMREKARARQTRRAVRYRTFDERLALISGNGASKRTAGRKTRAARLKSGTNGEVRIYASMTTKAPANGNGSGARKSRKRTPAKTK